MKIRLHPHAKERLIERGAKLFRQLKMVKYFLQSLGAQASDEISTLTAYGAESIIQQNRLKHIQ